MKQTRQILLIIASLVSLTFSACADIAFFKSQPLVTIGDYYPRSVENLDEVLAQIRARKNTIEKHPDWISISTQTLMTTNFESLSESDYPTYRKYLDDGILYIIVHPAYSVFFHENNIYPSSGTVVDSFLNETVFTKQKRLLQEQERSLRDFLEITSVRKRLILLILPGNYKDYRGYAYRDNRDEYARYINSVTNNSESVLYVYSEKPSKGNLSEQSRERLLSFIRTVDPKVIFIGGGYLGRCVQDFYKELAADIGKENITIAAEITAIAPEDVTNLTIDDILQGGKLNVSTLKDIIKSRDTDAGSFREFLSNYHNNRAQKKAGD